MSPAGFWASGRPSFNAIAIFLAGCPEWVRREGSDDLPHILWWKAGLVAQHSAACQAQRGSYKHAAGERDKVGLLRGDDRLCLAGFGDHADGHRGKSGSRRSDRQRAPDNRGQLRSSVTGCCPPDETSMKSHPIFFSSAANWVESSSAQPLPSTPVGCRETHTKRGIRATARTAEKTSRGNRMRVFPANHHSDRHAGWKSATETDANR